MPAAALQGGAALAAEWIIGLHKNCRLKHKPRSSSTVSRSASQRWLDERLLQGQAGQRRPNAQPWKQCPLRAWRQPWRWFEQQWCCLR